MVDDQWMHDSLWRGIYMWDRKLDVRFPTCLANPVYRNCKWNKVFTWHDRHTIYDYVKMDHERVIAACPLLYTCIITTWLHTHQQYA